MDCMTYNEKRELVERANKVIAPVKGVSCHISSFISFEPTIEISPEYVMMETDRKILAGPSPIRKEFPVLDEFKAANKAWLERARPLAEQAMKDACKLLKKAKIRYRTGRYYSWPVARLA